MEGAEVEAPAELAMRSAMGSVATGILNGIEHSPSWPSPGHIMHVRFFWGQM